MRAASPTRSIFSGVGPARIYTGGMMRPFLGPTMRVPVLGKRRGLGADYCRSNPPDAATVAILAARGESVNLIDCVSGGPPSPQTSPGPSVSAPSVFTMQPPVYQPPTGIQDCVALGLATSAGQACVQRNTQRSIDAEDAFLKAKNDFQTQLCISNRGGGWVPTGVDIATWCAGQYGGGATAPGGGDGSTSAGGGSTEGTVQYQPMTSFKNLSSGDASNFKVGDAWQLTISGAPPNAQVVVSGGANGVVATTPMGTTDANGSFAMQGTITADQVGMWIENWKSGGLNAGAFSFSVAAPAAPPSTGGGKQLAVTPPPVVPPMTGFDLSAVTTLLTNASFFGIPNWVLILGGVGAVVLLGGKHGR